MVLEKKLKNLKRYHHKLLQVSEILKSCIKKKISIHSPILIFGKTGCGKTKFGLWLKKTLGNDFPFLKISANSNGFSEIEQINEMILYQKKSVGIRIFESIEYYEGEVTDLILKVKPSIYSIEESGAILTLKTLEGKLRLKISGALSKELIFKKIKIGNIIRIIPETLSVHIIGISDNFIDESSITNLNKFTVPSGKVLKKKILIKEITLYDFEIENCGNKRDLEFMNIDYILRLNLEIESLLHSYNKSRKAVICKGILFIDDAHYLTRSCLNYLTKPFKNWCQPVIIMASQTIDFYGFREFSLNSFDLEYSNSIPIIPFKNFRNNDTLKILCFSFLNEKKFISGLGIKKIKEILRITNLDYCFNLILFSYVAISLEKFPWICKNTLFFFNFIILENKEFFKINLSKNFSIKIHRSL